MGTVELIFISIGLAMDAFAASICKGLNMTKINYRHAFVIALFFGVFQAGMPVIGYILGSKFQRYIESVDHWVAFFLLALTGGQMIYEALSGGEDEGGGKKDVLNIKELFVLAIATSIDALAVGITFAILDGVGIVSAAATIGIVTFVISFAGVVIGNAFGAKYEKKAQFAGGAVLVLIGAKILLEHTGIIDF